jgi:hypothetical protein
MYLKLIDSHLLVPWQLRIAPASLSVKLATYVVWIRIQYDITSTKQWDCLLNESQWEWLLAPGDSKTQTRRRNPKHCFTRPTHLPLKASLFNEQHFTLNLKVTINYLHHPWNIPLELFLKQKFVVWDQAPIIHLRNRGKGMWVRRRTFWTRWCGFLSIYAMSALTSGHCSWSSSEYLLWCMAQHVLISHLENFRMKVSRVFE